MSLGLLRWHCSRSERTGCSHQDVRVSLEPLSLKPHTRPSANPTGSPSRLLTTTYKALRDLLLPDLTDQPPESTRLQPHGLMVFLRHAGRSHRRPSKQPGLRREHPCFPPSVKLTTPPPALDFPSPSLPPSLYDACHPRDCVFCLFTYTL